MQTAGLSFVTAQHGQLTANVSTKFVWRVTGSGDPTFVATGPDGTAVHPDWGPEDHGGSTFNQPGGEWGTGFTFPSTGCWTVRVTRDGKSAETGVLVR